MLVTNWALEARHHEIAPLGLEIQQEREIRQASTQAYRDAVSDLQNKWVEAYDEALRMASSAVAQTSGITKKREERKRDFYRIKKQQIPPPLNNTASMATREEVVAAKKAPFFFLDRNDRLGIWRDRITRDILASVLENSRNVVDIRQVNLLYYKPRTRLTLLLVAWQSERRR